MIAFLIYLTLHCEFQTVMEFINRAGDGAWTWLPKTIFVVHQ